MVSRRRFMGKVLLSCFIVLVIAGSSAAFDAVEVSNAIYQAIKANEPFPLANLPDGDKTEANAYQAQNLLLEKLLTERKDVIVGYKGGLTAEAQMKRFGAENPVSAPLFESGFLQVTDPAAFVKVAPFGGIMLETEFAFKTASPITAPVKDEAELRTLIKSVHAAIEVPQVWFPDMSRLGAFDLTAALVGSRVFIVGPPQPTDLNLDEAKVVLTRNGAVVNEGKGSDALGSQWKTLLWLVGNVLAHGQKIEADQYFLTGALGKMIPGAPGEYRAEYPFGTLLFTVEEK
jgi:2-keto-4-pentenoate hydratase